MRQKDADQQSYMAISSDRLKTMFEIIAKENGLKYDLLIEQLSSQEGLLPKKLLNEHYLVKGGSKETKTKTPPTPRKSQSKTKTKTKTEAPIFASKAAEELAKSEPALSIDEINRSGKWNKITLKDVKDAIECQLTDDEEDSEDEDCGEA